MSAVHILQGLPGVGKTTFLRRQFGSTPILICSADHFLVDPEGVYRVSRQGLANAHGRCLQKYVGALQGGTPEPVVVDNTNFTVAEIAPYVALAQAYGAPVRIWHLDAAPADCRGSTDTSHSTRCVRRQRPTAPCRYAGRTRGIERSDGAG